MKGVNPLLSIAWGQSCYYNAYCPVDSGGSCYHARTGCGATAMAMIMKYWDFPAHGYGSNAYENPPYGLLSADFENTWYDWLNMPPQLNSQSTSTEIDAVAELMFQCGMAQNMVYGTNGSSSDNWNIRNAFTDHFNYSSESQFVDKADYPDSTWINIMQGEIDNGRPVFYGISSGSGGHFVVMDGYLDDEYFHYNWGYGNLNGYYKTFDELPIIQQAIIGIQPNSEMLTGTKEFYAYNGVFNDGSNHNQYPNNKTYHWLIKPESTASIVILFTEFATEYQVDFINIYDGETTASPLLGSFSGHELPPVIQSGGDKVLVEFISNDLISDQGWNLRYTTLRNDLACSGISVLTDSTGIFDDGSSTSNYIDNADCFWLIKPDTASSINLHFENFYTETDWDFLYVYNGEKPSPENLLATFTGNISPPNISSTGGAMLLHFHSDWNTNRPGWEVSYTTNYERINLDIKVFLEGPFLGSGMSTGLNAMLPHNQPYDVNSSARWYYEGNETVDPIPGFDIVDWILVELR
ncbi:MAG: C10 family peptidase, partial [Bacteroidales bacterium]|nr:C10 family peptidase [Bacteroidales bacterium]